MDYSVEYRKNKMPMELFRQRYQDKEKLFAGCPWLRPECHNTGYVGNRNPVVQGQTAGLLHIGSWDNDGERGAGENMVVHVSGAHRRIVENRGRILKWLKQTAK